MPLTITAFDGTAPLHAGYVRRARHDLISIIGAKPSAPLIEPLPYATYLGVFAEQQLVGFSEAFRYVDAFGGFEAGPFAPCVDLHTVCPPTEMAHIRSAYLDPVYRQRTALFARLYLQTARVFLDRGLRFSTLLTTDDPYLAALYAKMGATLLCATRDFHGQQGVELRLMLVDLRALLAHPFAMRIGLAPTTGPIM